MNKEEALRLMVDSMNLDTLKMCEQANMSKDESDKIIEQNQPSVEYMLSNIYDKMKEANLINS
jgi:hypothetical protein